MLLGAVSVVDLAVVLLFAVPQLFYRAGLFSSIGVFIKLGLFLSVQLPWQLCRDRFLKPEERSPFSRKATISQDITVKFIRKAFTTFPPKVIRVFLSKWVFLPLLRFRLLRHGYLRSPFFYREVVQRNFKGLWIIGDETSDPDIVIYYCHGGCFVVGSTYFYLEFLMTWLTLLKERGYRNPACFAVEYTLAPEAQAPTQLIEARAGYQFLLDSLGDESARKICLSGDSAGGMLALSLLLYTLTTTGHDSPVASRAERPGLAILISPWTHLVSELNRDTPSDYLDQRMVHEYAHQYAGRAALTDDILSPGLCEDKWKDIEPENGFRIVYGAEEVFAPAIEAVAAQMKKNRVLVKAYRREASIHVWPMLDLLFGRSREERLGGLDILTDCIVSSTMAPKSREQGKHT